LFSKIIKQVGAMVCLLSVILGANIVLAADPAPIRAPIVPPSLNNVLILPHNNADSAENDFGGRLLPLFTTIVISACAGASVLFIIIGAVEMLTAYGNDEKISAGKKTITFAIVGLVIAMLSYAIVTIISSINLNPAPPPAT